MKFLIIFINDLLYILSSIGDLVLFYLKLVFWLIRKLFEPLSNKILQAGLFFKNTKDNIDKKAKLAAFRFFLSYKSLRSKLFKSSKRVKAKKKEKQITIYPAPRNILLKLRFFIFGFLVCFVFIMIPLSLYLLVNSLPNPKSLSNREIPQTTKIYDRNGKLLYQIYANENRTLVPLSQIPKNLINATISIEDKDFYKNPGFDVAGITRAAIADLSGKPIQGGSTITQQLIKSTLLTPEVSITRKVKEIILAFWAERIYKKNEILEMYFNQVPYGGTAWGVEAASETYFGKNVRELSLAESAFLAGMPQAPTTYSPYGQNPNLWKKRQIDVLSKMKNLKYISEENMQEALTEELVFQSPRTPIYAPHFVMYVKDLLIQKYGLPMVEKGGLNVITTLDLNTQNMAQEVVTTEVDNNWYLNLTNGSALVTNPKNGDILAMVGSRDYNDPNGGNVNLTTALRQPGSSIKVVTYAAALSNGFTAATVLDDSPVVYQIPGSVPYAPVNYDGGFHGKVPLRIAFANSFNIPAVKTLAKIGVPTMVETAKKMGITTWKSADNYGLSITLGAAEVKMTELATVYGTVANLGEKVELNPFLKITNKGGDVFYQKENVTGKKVIDPGVAYIISNILSDNGARSIEFGTSSPLNIPGRVVSVKTGTTDNKRDNWTVGFTPDLLVAVWVGNNDNSPMSPSLASGITGAAPIWNKILTNLIAKEKSVLVSTPPNIVLKKCGSRMEYFIKGTENLASCYSIATPSGKPI
ncbi:MAG: hypothetical protein A2684_00425 [Candidatus Levybacteria bacterium RIFCSPHIGHO2_01_FULL_36_15b]|nr:MAG: hypothetical protein A2684_00425 [Candidatus Levybacteria bacterium RIFCSPHIGHO2_01_FULL_36_15b]